MADLGAIGTAGSTSGPSAGLPVGGASAPGACLRLVVNSAQSLVTDSGVLAGLWVGATFSGDSQPLLTGGVSPIAQTINGSVSSATTAIAGVLGD